MVKSNAARRGDGAEEGKGLRVIAGGLKDGEGGIDPVIHQRMRLAIVSALAVNRGVTFGELKQLLGMSDGNLSVHTQKLEAAGYVACKKTFKGRKPCSTFSLTKAGRAALERYLDHMASLVAAVRGGNGDGE